jgi:hypothetical protein
MAPAWADASACTARQWPPASSYCKNGARGDEHKRQKPRARALNAAGSSSSTEISLTRRTSGGAWRRGSRRARPRRRPPPPPPRPASSSGPLDGHVQAEAALTHSRVSRESRVETTWLTRIHLKRRLAPLALAVTTAAINSTGRMKAEEAAWKLLPGVWGGGGGGGGGRSLVTDTLPASKKRQPPARAHLTTHQDE